MARSRHVVRATFERLVVLREANGRSREVVLSFPWCRIAVTPVITPTGFGQRQFIWDGRQHTVQGLPIYREAA